ncbi:MAG: glycosyltransferase [Bacteroidales bacterium]|nr:glycosyltransferase [Bacteroidales bacterium]
MFYSIIIPVYNRPDEIEELLESLELQTIKPFEVVIVEDGSTLPCNETVDNYNGRLNIIYHVKPNTGRSDSRNVGMQLATKDYFVFTDSDCVFPADYFERLDKELQENYSDCFGGPDAAHESFSDVQKAINYAMTSFFTTGGIRGGKQQMEKFKPRTFNMGFSRAVFEKVGGFKDMFGEDIDLSIRITDAGFRTMLFHDVYVYHKRRVSFRKFFKQIFNFGTARINLALLHKGSLKIVHTFPALFLLGAIVIVFMAIFHALWWLLFPATYSLLLFADSFGKTNSLKTASLSVWASYIQITAYGWGFLTSFVQKIIFRRGLETAEILKQKYK